MTAIAKRFILPEQFEALYPVFNELFNNIKHLHVEGNTLVMDEDVVLPDQTIDDSQLRDSAALSVIGRSQNTAGSPADIQAGVSGTYLSRQGTALVFAAIADADIPASIARDTEVATAITDHVALTDPHTQYLTQTEGDARYVQLSTVSLAALQRIFVGTGTPEAVVTAGIGSIYLRTNGGAGTSLYVKESGAGNTGWIGK